MTRFAYSSGLAQHPTHIPLRQILWAELAEDKLHVSYVIKSKQLVQAATNGTVSGGHKEGANEWVTELLHAAYEGPSPPPFFT